MEGRARTSPAGCQPINTPLTSPPVRTCPQERGECHRRAVVPTAAQVWISLWGRDVSRDETLMIPVGGETA